MFIKIFAPLVLFFSICFADVRSAIFEGNTQQLLQLLQDGANPSEPISIGYEQGKIQVTPLQFAIIRGEEEAVDILMDTGGMFTTEPLPYIGNPLHIAVHFGQSKMLDHLLTTYADSFFKFLEKRNSSGQTPFSLAAALDYTDCMKVLHAHRANIESQDNLKRRPIHYAAIENQKEAIDYLAYLGASIEPRDSKRKTPADLSKNQEIKNLLNNLAKKSDLEKSEPPNFVKRPPENLVFKGGGPKGIAYIGAIEEMEKMGHLSEVYRIAGTSVGSITAGFLSVGYQIGELKQVLLQTKFDSFIDIPILEDKSTLQEIFSGLKEVYDVIVSPIDTFESILSTVWHTTGLADGEAARRWIEKYIKQKTGIAYFTFGELRKAVQEGKPYKHLHVFSTKIGNNPEIARFSSEDPKWDNLIISDAILASMSLPGVFKPHILHIKVQDARVSWEEGGQYLDGGILYNFPIDAFDFAEYMNKTPKGLPQFNPKTLGFNLYSSLDKTNENKQVDSIGGLAKTLADTYLNAEEILRATVPYNAYRVIDIDTLDVSTLDFGLSLEKRNMLVDSGEKAVDTFFTKAQQ